MLLLDNFTHADLHPGNIMIKFYKPTASSMLRDAFTRILSRFDSDYARGAAKGAPTPDQQVDQDVVDRLRPLRHDPDQWLAELEKLDALGYQPELVFIDAGLTVELSPVNRRNFIELFSAIAQFDGELAGHLMVERCRSPDLVKDGDVFALKMENLVASVKKQSFSLANIRIGDVLAQVLNNVREHQVKMEPDFVNTVISILLLEGIGRTLDGNMDVSAWRCLTQRLALISLPPHSCSRAHCPFCAASARSWRCTATAPAAASTSATSSRWARCSRCGSCSRRARGSRPSPTRPWSTASHAMAGE